MQIRPRPYLKLAIAACTAKFILYVVTQTIVLIGTPTYTRVSLDADLLCLAIALLAMCRARDAGTRGLFGFLGGIAAFYEIGFLPVFGFRATGIRFNASTVRVIAILPQVTQLLSIWCMSRRPSAPSSQLGTV